MPTGAAPTPSTSAPAPSTTTSRYQSSVAPHFPMKTMLTPRGPMTASAPKPAPVKTELSLSPSSGAAGNTLHCSSSGLLDANGSMAAAFAMSTAPGSNSATVVCKVPKFLRSLYAILQTEDPSVISWVQNQELKPNRVTAFHILDMERFEREILPKYFKHQKFASFQRQLNNFGFRKWTKTQSSGVCTFSHNSFPPDPTTAAAASGGVLRASFREQWRQKSPISASPLAMTASPTQPPRRRVGNGITKSDRKNNRRAVSVHVQIPHTESFMDLYKSPLNTVLLCDGRQQQHQQHQQHQQYAPSHQPATKKLARPLQELSGLEAFCDDTYKQFILPPLQPHHLLATTPRGLYAAMAGSDAEPTTPSLGGFPHARNLGASGGEYSNLKPYEYPEKPGLGAGANAGSHHSSMEASFTGAFLEPWSWDANMNSALELGTFPLDFDWQDANCSSSSMHHTQQQQQHLANVSVSVGVAPLQHQHQQQLQQQHKEAFCHPQDRAMASAEEFGFETFLFAE